MTFVSVRPAVMDQPASKTIHDERYYGLLGYRQIGVPDARGLSIDVSARLWEENSILRPPGNRDCFARPALGNAGAPLLLHPNTIAGLKLDNIFDDGSK